MKFDNYKMERLQALLKRLNHSLYEELSAKDVEQTTFYSYRNINRIFKLFLNKSIGQYFKEKKLAEGARQMVYHDKTASEVAFELGYNDLQAFNKAFKKVYQVSPAQYKENTHRDLEMSFHKKLEEKESEIENLRFQRVQLAPFQAVTLTHYGSYKSAGIADTWKELLQFAHDKKLLREESRYFGEILDDNDIEKDENCRYAAGVTLPDDAVVNGEGLFEIKKIEGGAYAVFQYKGDRDLIDGFYENIFAHWILEAAFEIADKPFMEFYLNHEPDTPARDLLTDVYIPIE